MMLSALSAMAENKVMDDGTGSYKLNSISGTQVWTGQEDEVVSVSRNSMTNPSTSSITRAGGAIYLNSKASLTITGYGAVSFDGNKATGYQAWGPALYSDSSYGSTDRTEFKVNGNGNVSFSDNECTPLIERAYGGAIYGMRSAYFQISNNNSVTLSKNKAVVSSDSAKQYANGGAIYMADGALGLDISGNTAGVTFENNKASAVSMVYGGAICYSSTKGNLTLNNNARLDDSALKFSGNQAVATKTSSVQGGAIYSKAEKTEISGNGSVVFDNNSAATQQTEANDPYATTVKGGAIAATSKLAIVGNKSVSFTGNYILANLSAPHPSSGSIYSMGGAIYADSGITLQGNDNVSFSGNYEYKADGYTMNSMYINGNAVISANEGGKVKFSDAFTVTGKVDLNSTYNGEVQNGDIVLSGATVENSLQAIKTAANAGDVTNEEIKRSKQFTVGGAVTLNAGTLTLDAAVLKAKALTIKSGTALILKVDSVSQAPITLSGNCEFERASKVVILLDEGNVGELSNASNELSVCVTDVEATTEGAEITAEGELGAQWYYDGSRFSWETKDGKTYITGTVNAVTEIQVTEEGELSESITDVADGTQRSVNVKGTIATLSGDNSHTGGTTIDNASVTLSSATAAGKGGITTTGNASITTAEDVTAELYQPIQNKDGVLTLTGSYDVSALTPDTINETWLDAQLNEGENGFYRHEGSSIQVVENENATIAEISAPSLKHDNGLSYTLDTATGIAVAEGETKWDTYYINTEDHTGTVSEMMTASNNRLEQVEMKAGVLNADASAKVNATGGSIFMTGQDVNLTGTLSGDTNVLVLGTGTITGDNTHTGDTVIAGENAKLTVGSATALGASTVTLQDHGTLDLNGMAVSNAINVTGCTISRAGNYDGTMEVSGELTLTDATTAKEVIIRGGSIEGASLRTTRLEVSGEQDGQITSDVTIADQGSIVLNNGAQLNITGSLTLGQGTTLTLAGDGYEAGSIPITWTGTLTGDTSALTLNMDGDYELVQDGDKLVLVEKTTEGEPEEDKPIVEPEEDAPIVEPEAPVAPVFDQATADALAQANWGVYTASRAFVGAVQGQRNNTGCIANGRGTAWGALLGATNSIDSNGIAGGSDTTLYGAAIGVDMKLGKRSVLGVAFGYTDAKVSADGLGDIDQEGGHIALYGEHGLKKFANDSCLSLDWVAATGTTESSYQGSDWEQDHLQFNTRLTWNKKVTERFAYNVFGGLEYFASESDRVQNCKTGSVQNLRGELGVGARYVVKKSGADVYDGKAGLCPAAPACERVVVYGELSYINDMVRSNPSIEVGGLRGSGANPGRQGVGIEAGATFRIGERWSANANYSFNAMDDANEHSLNLGASRTF